MGQFSGKKLYSKREAYGTVMTKLRTSTPEGKKQLFLIQKYKIQASVPTVDWVREREVGSEVGGSIKLDHCINQCSPEKHIQQVMYVWAGCTYTHMYTQKRLALRDWLLELWRMANPNSVGQVIRQEVPKRINAEAYKAEFLLQQTSGFVPMDFQVIG